jgi:hypothetical protein
MREFETESKIDAPADRVWAVLADTGGWSAWDSGVPDMNDSFRQFASGLKQRAETAG